MKRVWIIQVRRGPMGGQFPIDMLRYDRMTPSGENDSVLISATFSPRYKENDSIHLQGEAGGPAPNEARWNSFGWHVVEKRQL